MVYFFGSRVYWLRVRWISIDVGIIFLLREFRIKGFVVIWFLSLEEGGLGVEKYWVSSESGESVFKIFFINGFR